MNLDKTTPHAVTAKPVRYKGFDSLNVMPLPEHKDIQSGGCDNCTFLVLDGIKFRNGTIEIEVAGKPQSNASKWARGLCGDRF